MRLTQTSGITNSGETVDINAGSENVDSKFSSAILHVIYILLFHSNLLCTITVYKHTQNNGYIRHVSELFQN